MRKLAMFGRAWRVVAAIGLLASMALNVAGCADYQRRKALEDVAKGWCETIRASQVIPVYPLTEDLRPGDVFLVQTAIADEASRYQTKGFLPLDDYRGRLPLKANAYLQEYFDGYWQDSFYFRNGPNARPTRTPGPYPGVTTPAIGGKGDTPPPDKKSDDKKPDAPKPDDKNPGDEMPKGTNAREALLSQANAPRAAFPSYSFNVSSSGGLGLAIPIQSVPIGLNFLRAQSATGSVTIADARTYAADPQAVLQSLKEWAQLPLVHEQLRWAARQSDNPIYLRVVTRVYLTGAVNVSLTRKGAFSADVSAGKAPDVDLIDSEGKVNPKNDEAKKKLNNESPGNETKPTGDGKPATSSPAPENPAAPADPKPKSDGFDWAEAGGRFKFQSVSSSSVSMSEMFDTLLVVGYLGFDAPVFLDGSIGNPLPTFLRLERLVNSPKERRAAEGRFLQQKMLIQKYRDCAHADRSEQIRAAKIIAGVGSRLDPKTFQKSHALAKQVLEELAKPPPAATGAPDPTKNEPAKTEPAKADAGKADASKSEPAKKPTLADAVAMFLDDADDFVKSDAAADLVIRTDRFIEAFDTEFELSRVPAPKKG